MRTIRGFTTRRLAACLAVRLAVCLAAALCLLGPASSSWASDRDELLDKDHQAMSDEELVAYEAELAEAVEDCEDYTGTQNVGQGTSTGQSYGKDIGFSFGTRPGTKSCDSSDLRQRWIEVKAAMALRGL